MSYFSIDRGCAESKGEDVEKYEYSVRFSAFTDFAMGTTPTTPKSTSKKLCFNCSGEHNLIECQLPRNRRRISMARQQFEVQRSLNTPSSRYTEKSQMDGRMPPLSDEMRELSDLYHPGATSDKLREALGLRDGDLPSWIHEMRALGLPHGYPPGWLTYAMMPDEKNERLSIITANKSDELSQENEDGEIDDHNVDNQLINCERPIIDLSRLIEYEGFNVKSTRRDKNNTFIIPKWKEFEMIITENARAKRSFYDRLKSAEDLQKRMDNELEIEKRRVLDAPPPPEVIVLDDEGTLDKPRKARIRISNEDLSGSETESTTSSEIARLKDLENDECKIINKDADIDISDAGDSAFSIETTRIMHSRSSGVNLPNLNKFANGICSFEVADVRDAPLFISRDGRKKQRKALDILRRARFKLQTRNNQRYQKQENKQKWQEILLNKSSVTDRNPILKKSM